MDDGYEFRPRQMRTWNSFRQNKLSVRKPHSRQHAESASATACSDWPTKRVRTKCNDHVHAWDFCFCFILFFPANIRRFHFSRENANAAKSRCPYATFLVNWGSSKFVQNNSVPGIFSENQRCRTIKEQQLTDRKRQFPAIAFTHYGSAAI